MADEFSKRMDGGVTDAYDQEERPSEILPGMRQADGEKEVQRSAGGFEQIQSKKVLRPRMCRDCISKSECIAGGSPETEREVSRESVQDLQDNGGFASPPQGHEPVKQYPGEHYDPVCKVPHEIPLGTREAAYRQIRETADGGRWPEEPPDVPRIIGKIPDRANRLKCLGNAVVPAQFYPIFKAIFDLNFWKDEVNEKQIYTYKENLWSG